MAIMMMRVICRHVRIQTAEIPRLQIYLVPAEVLFPANRSQITGTVLHKIHFLSKKQYSVFWLLVD